MKLKLRKIGNSKGVLLPRKVVKPYEESGFIDLVVEKDLASNSTVECHAVNVEVTGSSPVLPAGSPHS